MNVNVVSKIPLEGDSVTNRDSCRLGEWIYSGWNKPTNGNICGLDDSGNGGDEAQQEKLLSLETHRNRMDVNVVVECVGEK
mmetsp:Transcript_27760/g.42726  ORF Transcript_27760/g.42726 Transcript_27760/m.42726 type:complete len:81 (-) Transcript_27760:2-244(-)